MKITSNTKPYGLTINGTLQEYYWTKGEAKEAKRDWRGIDRKAKTTVVELATYTGKYVD